MSSIAKRQVQVAVIQQGPRVADPAANLTDLLGSIDEAGAGGSDYIVATELSLTPYFCVVRKREYQRWAVSLESEAVQSVAARARKYKTTIIFPFYRYEASEDRYYNSAIVIGPDGEVVSGRLANGQHVACFTKVHIPNIKAATLVTDESYHFTAGNAFPVFETPKAKVGILICYDRRFPEAWRALALSGAEIVFLPSCVPAWDPAQAASSSEMFVAELRTRALENLIFVAACNRAGFEMLEGKRTLFFGNSCVIAPGGTVVAQGLANAPCLLRANIDLAEVSAARQRLPLLRDRRAALYGMEG